LYHFLFIDIISRQVLHLICLSLTVAQWRDIPCAVSCILEHYQHHNCINVFDFVLDYIELK
jgi:hypothetical protein